MRTTSNVSGRRSTLTPVQKPAIADGGLVEATPSIVGHFPIAGGMHCGAIYCGSFLVNLIVTVRQIPSTSRTVW